MGALVTAGSWTNDPAPPDAAPCSARPWPPSRASAAPAFTRSPPTTSREVKLTREARGHATRPPGPRITVVPDDWGVATARVTREAGEPFAVSNMANAFVPGGAYVEGAIAQEENLFRRTDCHEALDDTEMDPTRERYTPGPRS
jgi:hypothetical protein